MTFAAVWKSVTYALLLLHRLLWLATYGELRNLYTLVEICRRWDVIDSCRSFHYMESGTFLMTRTTFSSRKWMIQEPTSATAVRFEWESQLKPGRERCWERARLVYLLIKPLDYRLICQSVCLNRLICTSSIRKHNKQWPEQAKPIFLTSTTRVP